VRLTNRAGVPLWESDLLAGVPGIRHGFTTRMGGVSRGDFESLNVSLSVGDDPESVYENRCRLASAFHVRPTEIRLHTQIHGNTVAVLPVENSENPLRADAFITKASGVPAIVGIADCVPILVAAEDGSAVAAIHAGWRGAVAGIVPETIDLLKSAYGIDSSALRAVIGPAIGKCCFEVGEEVSAQFPVECVDQTGTNPHVDLPRYVFRQLTHAGVCTERIDRSDVCTMCRQDVCFSHRGSGGRTGRMVALIIRV
jgi:polyphenol oxidase